MITVEEAIQEAKIMAFGESEERIIQLASKLAKVPVKKVKKIVALKKVCDDNIIMMRGEIV